jgi:tellurium resistance protein TerZ
LQQIKIDLDNVPEHVKSMVFTVNSFSGQSFDQVEHAYGRIVDSSNDTEVPRYTLSAQGAHTAQIMAKLYRHDGEWEVQAIGENGFGRTIDALLPQIVIFL